MRLDYLHLHAFGHFENYPLTFEQQKQFHLIYGPNEAGKSTMLRSIWNLLYGIPDKTTDSFHHDNKKLRIEGKLSRLNGESLHFIRRKGRKNTVLDVEENPIAEELVKQFLNGTAHSHFLNMFALDHVRLREGGDNLLKSGGNAGEGLFSAASGLSTLRTVMEQIEEQSRDLYKKGGSKPKINQLIKEEKEINRKLAESALAVQKWKELDRSYQEGKRELDDVRQQYEMLNRKKEKLQRIRYTLPKIAKRDNLLHSIQQYGSLPNLPEDGKRNREKVEQKLAQVTSEKAQAEKQRKLLIEKKANIQIPETLLQQEHVIQDLYREINIYQDNVKKSPLIEQSIAQMKQKVLSLLKEIDHSTPSLDRLEHNRLTTGMKRTLKELIDEKPLLDQQLNTIEKEEERVRLAKQRIDTDLKKLGSTPDTLRHLGDEIAEVRSDGKLEAQLQALEQEIKTLEWDIHNLIKQLPLWDGTIEELNQLPVPNLVETIKQHKEQYVELQQQIQLTKDKITEEQERIEKSEKDIQELEFLANIPTEEELRKARKRRSEGWKLIKLKLQYPDQLNAEQVNAYSGNEPLDFVYEQSVTTADDVADQMRLEAEKIGQKSKLRADIHNGKKRLQKQEETLAQLQKSMKAWERNWEQLWSGTNISPLSPVEMEEWIGKFHHIKQKIEVYYKHVRDQQQLQSRIEARKVQLAKYIENLESLPTTLKLADVIQLAEKWERWYQQHVTTKRQLMEEQQKIEEKEETLTVERNYIETEIQNWRQKWEKALLQMQLPQDMSTKAVESIVELYEESLQLYQEMIEKEHELQRIRKQIVMFEEKVAQLREMIPDLDGEPDVVVHELYGKVQRAKEDSVRYSHIVEQLESIERKIEEANESIDKCNQYLRHLLNQGNCDSIEELKQIEEKVETVHKYRREIEQLETDLLEQGGGRSIEELMAEAREENWDNIELELEETTRAISELDRKRSTLEQHFGAVKKEYNEKIKGSSLASVQASEERENVLAELQEQTEQYIQLKLASMMLQKGIEYYRNENQNPILKRASDLFARLTLQSFAGLTVDYDDKDEPVLIGLRVDGEKVSIDGMSDGTTDQLYLALRIASIERYATTNEPIPFIVDDILIHFDEQRSKETLQILMELAERTQIIFFTHHFHIVELMNSLFRDSQFQYHEIKHEKVDVVKS
ncbi:YhaN family protein [Salirhabdus salicampi]|uniref:YhaN family protein n=1 Tax=Salirhabdus salicampi TaxID=476102 RepID=UPI0020C4E290|nr:YhaN family protein [Salirhabdus salicampi]MCP8617587.1 AAA family ATPase [Salirhabdus salicampi]